LFEASLATRIHVQLSKSFGACPPVVVVLNNNEGTAPFIKAPKKSSVYLGCFFLELKR
jgi:hypothetical protein